jgi:hypothetical protein
MSRTKSSPPAQHLLINVQSPPLFAVCLHNQVNMRVLLIGMQVHGASVPFAEFLAQISGKRPAPFPAVWETALKEQRERTLNGGRWCGHPLARGTGQTSIRDASLARATSELPDWQCVRPRRSPW